MQHGLLECNIVFIGVCKGEVSYDGDSVQPVVNLQRVSQKSFSKLQLVYTLFYYKSNKGENSLKVIWNTQIHIN